jgi:ABC-type branched-subunit amino acid transport system substrate-binding protein
MQDLHEMRDAVATAFEAHGDAVVAANRQVTINEPDYGVVLGDVRSQCRATTNGQDCDGIVLVLDSYSAVKYFASAQSAGVTFDVTELAPFALSQQVALGVPMGNAVGWTGFIPPIEDGSEGATRYASDMHAASEERDLIHPYTEAAYVGTMVLAQAIGRVGVNLTRDALKAVLDSQSFDLDVTASPLSWALDKHANRSARGYRGVYTGTFAGWRRVDGWRSAI